MKKNNEFYFWYKRKIHELTTQRTCDF